MKKKFLGIFWCRYFTKICWNQISTDSGVTRVASTQCQSPGPGSSLKILDDSVKSTFALVDTHTLGHS